MKVITPFVREIRGRYVPLIRFNHFVSRQTDASGRCLSDTTRRVLNKTGLCPLFPLFDFPTLLTYTNTTLLYFGNFYYCLLSRRLLYLTSSYIRLSIVASKQVPNTRKSRRSPPTSSCRLDLPLQGPAKKRRDETLTRKNVTLTHNFLAPVQTDLHIVAADATGSLVDRRDVLLPGDDPYSPEVAVSREAIHGQRPQRLQREPLARPVAADK
jgi:hypothetical protein